MPSPVCVCLCVETKSKIIKKSILDRVPQAVRVETVPVIVPVAERSYWDGERLPDWV